MILDSTVTMPYFLVGGIAHLGVGQDRQVVELDAVVLAVLDQLVDALRNDS